MINAPVGSFDGQDAGPSDRDRSDFLADATRVLTGSLDPKITLRQLTRMCVPRLADWVTAYLLEDDGSIVPVALSRLDSEKERWAWDLVTRYPLEPEATAGAPHVMRTGRHEVYPVVTDDTLVRVSRDEEHLRLWRSVAPTSAMIFPLEARGRIVGAVTFLHAESGRHYTDADAAFARELVRVSALAVDNALLFREAQWQRNLLEQQGEASIDGILVVGPDGRILWSNRRFGVMWGIPDDVLASKSDDEAIRSVVAKVSDPDSFLARITLLYDHPEMTSRDEITLNDGRIFDRWSAPVRMEPDGIAGRAWYFRDVTEQKRLQASLSAAERRAAFLSDAGALFAAAVDTGEICRGLARLSVPLLGEWCLVDLIGDRGEVRRVAVGHADAAAVDLAGALLQRPPWVPDAVRLAIDSERPRVSSEVPPVTLAGRTLAPAGLLAIPLSARGHTLGSVAFISERRRYGEADVSLAKELAARAAPALDNARLYQERARIARTLQEGLIPSRLPEVPGVEVEARYRAAGEAMDAGGDFYDVVPMSDESFALVLGDVCGKGARAAAITALARYTIRAATLRPARPREVLETLNEALLREDLNERFCTVALVRLERRDDAVRATLSIAGHPPPMILRADGSVEQVDEHGTALGIVERPRLVEAVVTLRPGDALVLATDGYFEARGPYGELGETGFRAFLSECRGKTAAEIADCIEQRTNEFQGGRQRDDMALLVARVAP